jgi:CubicO group peptidase (beta-lactamase class C family)
MQKITALSLMILFIFSCQPVVEKVLKIGFIDGSPQSAGLIPERLSQIDQAIQEAIENGEVAGTVAIIARNGVIGYHKAFGMADMEAGKEMNTKNLFRIASMTKLMTTVGALMLFEKGRYDLNTKLSDILPEFNDAQILEGWDESKKEFITRPAENPILMKHVFTHTSGIGYPGSDPIGREGYFGAKVQSGWPNMEITLEENIKRLAALPLLHEPGEKWTYGMGMDVLGRIIEVLDGRPFAQYMEEELFGPLGLDDTGFQVPEADWDRVAQVYTTDEEGKLAIYSQETFDQISPNNYKFWWKKDANIIATGGAGVVTSAYDYARFLQMVLNDGELDGVRILGRKTVELLRRPLFEDFDGKSTDFGLSVWVLATETDAYAPFSVGSYGWGGYFYTSYWIDPKEKLVAVIMNQVSPAKSTLNSKFETLTYSAIE